MLAKAINSERVRRGFSLHSLSKAAEIDRGTIRDAEFLPTDADADNQANPTVSTLIKISIALGFDLGELISDCTRRVDAGETEWTPFTDGDT